jgi:glycine/D-amino acid oxidase-like deaminating enzyme
MRPREAHTIPPVSNISRRDLLASIPLVAASAALAKQTARGLKGAHVVVVGAGAFGGWTAWNLQRHGARVTLIDAWGPGNARASSGGETRVIRAIYNGDERYIEWVARALELWRAAETRWHRRLFHEIGALWMFSVDDAYARNSLAPMRERMLRVEELARPGAAKRYPQIDFSGVKSIFFEPEAGYVMARQSCREVARAFAAEGGTLRLRSVRPVDIATRLRAIALADGTALQADHFVFAAGPWLGDLLPELLGTRITPSRQEVFFFGTNAGDASFQDMPVWVDFDQKLFYGIPDNESRGFKVADDTRGTAVDPTSLDRMAAAEGLAAARAFLARRFPRLRDAPLLESRVCQYENSPDGDLILDRHPHAANVWIAGGGSGHGFKLGPVVGEVMSAMIAGSIDPLGKFSFRRFETE